MWKRHYSNLPLQHMHPVTIRAKLLRLLVLSRKNITRIWHKNCLYSMKSNRHRLDQMSSRLRCAAFYVWGSPSRWASGLRDRRHSDKLWWDLTRSLTFPSLALKTTTNRHNRSRVTYFPCCTRTVPTVRPLTFVRLLLFSRRPAGGLVLHALQRSQWHVEVTVRTAPEGAQTLAVEILGVLKEVETPESH